MGRPARRLTGVVGVLAAALVFVAMPATGASQPAMSAIEAASVGAPAATSKVTAEPLSAKAAKAATAAVELPRPVHGDTAIRLLGDRLDEAAALNDMSADGLVELLHSDPSAWVDSAGAVFHEDAPVRAAPAARSVRLPSAGSTSRAAASAPVAGLSATADPLMANVTLSWTAPATAVGDSAITGYRLTRTGSTDYAQVSASTTRYTWTGLTYGTSYTFTVTPLDANGSGTESSAHAVTSTGVVVPGAPRTLTATWNPVSQTAVVGWSAPPSVGSAAVQHYALYLDGTFYRYYDPSTTGLRLAGLSPGVSYTFGVAAVSSAGTGPRTTATVAVPARAANDDFAQRATIGGVSGAVDGDNTESSDERWEPAPTAKRAGAGKASVWYSWTAPASGPVTMTTASSSTGRDTTLDVLTGSSVATLRKVAGNDDPSDGDRLAVVTFDAAAGQTYAIAVNGYRTSATGVGPFSLSWLGTAIGAKTTTTILTADTDTVDGGARSVKLTAVVTASFGRPLGHVYFSDGSTVVGDDLLTSTSPAPTLTLPDLPRGVHEFSATFVPSDGDLFVASTSSTKMVPISATATGTTLRGSAQAQQVTLTAAVAPPAAGTVEFTEGGALVGSGTVTYGKSTVVLTGATPGNHSYVATFVPADLEKYAGSPSTASTVTVAAYPPAKATTTALSAEVSGRTARLVATVTAEGATPVGAVQVKDGATVVGTATLSAGSATLALDDLTRGTHALKATFVPADTDDFAASTSAATSLAVAATPTATALTTSLSGRTVTLQTTVSPAAAGTVRLSDGGALDTTITLSGGAGRIDVPDVAVGTHHYTATFVPADGLRQEGSTSPTQDVTVDPAATATALGSSVTAHQVDLTATVTGSGAPAGSVTFYEGGDVVGTGTVSGGVASLPLSAVATGTHTYTATFTPTDPAEQAASVSSNHTATVVATPTTTGLSASATGQVVTLSGSVSTAADTLAGKLEFYEGSTLVGTVPWSGASADLQLPNVAPGGHSYVAKFVPTGTTHASSSSAARIATVMGSTATTLQASVAGTAVTLTAAVTGPGTPAGTVQFKEGSNLLGTKPLSAGAASLSVPTVTAGEHSYVATFVPTVPSEYAGSASGPQTVDVARVATATSLTATVNGQSVDLSATVTAASGTLAGSVEFRDGGTVVVTRPVTSTQPTATATDAASYGAHSYTATFVPTGTVHNGSTSPARTVAVRGTTTTTLATSVTGRTVTATAVVAGDGTTPSGSVRFYRDGTEAGIKPLVDGTAVYPANDVVPGSYNYTATFIPTSTHSASSSAASVATVAKIQSTTTLQATAQDQTVTLKGTVTNGSAGKVQFRDGDTVVGSVAVATGTASLTLANVTPGDHTYVATFVPTDPTVYVGSDSDAKTVTVARIATATSLTATAAGQTVTLIATPATASGRLTGSVELRDGATFLESVTLTETTVVRTLTDVTPGSHTYTAKFVPTGTTHAGSTSPPRTVTAAERSSTTDLDVTVDVQTVTLDATVASGSRKPPGKVVFRDGTTVLATVDLVGGAAPKQLQLVTPGSHSYTATFVPADPTTYTGSASPSRTVRVLPIVTTTGLVLTHHGGQEVELAARVTGASGLPAGKVVFRESGTFFRKVPVHDGSAVLDLDHVAPGSHSYTATFVPTDPTTYAGSASSDQPVTIDPIATTTGLTALAGVSTVRLEAGLDSGAAGRIVFKQRGTFVGQVTLADSAAVLTLADVEPGTYTYTATFVPLHPATYAGSVSPDRDVTVKIPTSSDLTTSVAGRVVWLDATVTGAGSPAGKIVFTDDGAVVGSKPVASGAARLELTGVDPGDHRYQASFVPDASGTVAASASVVRSTTVAPLGTTTSLSTTVDGRKVTLEAKVTSTGGSPAGTVEFREGSTVVGTTRLRAGAAPAELTGVPPGVHAYRAFFTPDDPVRFAFSSTDPWPARVAAAATGTDLTVTADRRTVSFKAKVTSSYAVPAGTVIIREGSQVLGTADLVDGTARLELAGVDPGLHGYTATYVPTSPATYVGSTSPERSVTVTATGLTVTVSVREVILEAAVTPASGTAAGKVVFRDGADIVYTAAVNGGVASTKLTGVTPGAHAYTATFVPSDPATVAGSVSPVSEVTVAPIGTTTTLATEVAVRAVTLSADVSLTVAGQSETVEGEVVFRDGDQEVGRDTVSNGAASVPLTGVRPGPHNYTATFVPADAVLLARSVSLPTAGRVTVDPIGTTTTLAEPDVTVRTVTLSADVSLTVAGQSEAVEGDVVFLDDKIVVGKAAVVDGAASAPLTDVRPGSHSYTATFVPADPVLLAGGTSDPRVTVVAPIGTSTQLTATASGRTVTLSAAVTSPSDTLAGSVVFREGANVVGTVAARVGVASKMTLTNVASGKHTYTATFDPTSRVTFGGSKSGDETVTVDPVVTTTALLATVSGRAVTLTATPATAEGALTGAVEFRDGTELLGTVPLAGGTAVLRLADVASGPHTYTATFVPTGKIHGTSSATQGVAVPYASTTNLTVTNTGSQVNLAAEVTSGAASPKGKVAFYDGDRTLGPARQVDGSGRAGLAVQGVFGGTHTYRAVFVPAADDVLTSSTTSSHVVSPTATATGLVAERKPGSRRVVLTATISAALGSPAGSVTFRDGTIVVATVPVAAGKARTTLISVATGTHAYAAAFVPTSTATYAASSSQADFPMPASVTTTEISVRNVGGTVTVDAKVTSPDGVPTGQVRLTQDDVAVPTLVDLDAGTATVKLGDVAGGVHTYVATYVPDDASYQPSVSQGVTGKVTVTFPAAVTTTSLGVEAVGRTVTLSAEVTSLGGTPAGSVVFIDGRTELPPVAVAAGKASLTLPGVTAGPHTYGAVFVPTDPAVFAGSSAPGKRVTVHGTATATTTSITGSVDGTTATLRVTVAGADGLAPFGTVLVVDGNDPVGQGEVIDGSATLVVTGAAAGEHSYRATFAPSTADFAGSMSSAVVLTVRPVASTMTLKAPAKATAGSSPTVQVTVLRGTASAAGKVQLTYGSKKVTLTLKGGRASFKLPKVKKGKLEVTATYLGDATTARSTATRSIKIRG